ETGISGIRRLLIGKFGAEQKSVLGDTGREFVGPVCLVDDVLAIIRILVSSNRRNACRTDRRGRIRIDVSVKALRVLEAGLVDDRETVVERVIDLKHYGVCGRGREAQLGVSEEGGRSCRKVRLAVL